MPNNLPILISYLQICYSFAKNRFFARGTSSRKIPNKKHGTFCCRVDVISKVVIWEIDIRFFQSSFFRLSMDDIAFSELQRHGRVADLKVERFIP